LKILQIIGFLGNKKSNNYPKIIQSLLQN